MSEETTIQDLESLITDPDFLFLVRQENRPNLFNTVAASTTEMWHSAFVRWVLDPSSHLGLGDFPLKRFLHAVLGEEASDGAAHEILPAETGPTPLSFSDIEGMSFEGISFETEFKDASLGSPTGKGQARLDIYAYLESDSDDRPSIQIVIENKVYAREHADQTETYHRWAEEREFSNSVYVFLTPDEEQMPQNSAFVQLTYQRFCDQVLWPVKKHPGLSEESRYLIEQYMLNLNRNAKGESMAQVNKTVCEDLYRTYQAVFDQIYLAVGKEPPQADGSGTKLRRFAVSLSDLVGKGLLDPKAVLSADYHGAHTATLVQTQESIQIQLAGETGACYPSLSKAAQAITGRPTNGWTFWKIKDQTGTTVRLDELRDRFQ